MLSRWLLCAVVALGCALWQSAAYTLVDNVPGWSETFANGCNLHLTDVQTLTCPLGTYVTAFRTTHGNKCPTGLIVRSGNQSWPVEHVLNRIEIRCGSEWLPQSIGVEPCPIQLETEEWVQEAGWTNLSMAAGCVIDGFTASPADASGGSHIFYCGAGNRVSGVQLLVNNQLIVAMNFVCTQTEWLQVAGDGCNQGVRDAPLAVCPAGTVITALDIEMGSGCTSNLYVGGIQISAYVAGIKIRCGDEWLDDQLLRGQPLCSNSTKIVYEAPDGAGFPSVPVATGCLLDGLGDPAFSMNIACPPREVAAGVQALAALLGHCHPRQPCSSCS